MGGHHKLPMADLRKEMDKLNFKNVQTLLNSGNIIFSTNAEDSAKLEDKISNHLKKTFGFPVPTLLRNSDTILRMVEYNPFKNIKLTKETRLYVTFLREESEIELPIPWISDDRSYQILSINENSVFSVLDLSLSKTPKAMEALERFFGADLTSRNWNTILKIGTKLVSKR